MTSIDFRTLPSNVPVMCIPRAFLNIDEKRIRSIFDELNMGAIDHIDIIGKSTEKGEKFNRIFVHFKKWFSNPNAVTARERLINGKEIKIIYDDPWFWKISAYREAEKPQRPVAAAAKKVSIQFDDDEDEKKSPILDEFGRDISRKPEPKPQQKHHHHHPQQYHQPHHHQQHHHHHQPQQKQQQPREQKPREHHARPQQQPREHHQEVKKDEKEMALDVHYPAAMPVKQRKIIKKVSEKAKKELEDGEIEEN